MFSLRGHPEEGKPVCAKERGSRADLQGHVGEEREELFVLVQVDPLLRDGLHLLH